MFDFLQISRDYKSARAGYRPEVPEVFNFGFDVIDHHAAVADKTAVIAVAGDGQETARLSYANLSRRSNRVALGLRALGIEPGTFACLVAGHIPEWYDALFGCIKVGVVAMPGTTLLTAKDLAYRINHAKASSVIVSPEHCEKLEAVRADCPSLKHCIVIGEERHSWVSLEALAAGQADEIPAEQRVVTRASDMMMAYFTSGTTAMPKMVPRNHAYSLEHACTGLFWMDLRLIKSLGVTTFCAPPTIYRLFAQQDLSAYDLSSLRRSLGAGEPLNPEVIRIWAEATGTMIADGYDQTETVNIVANFPDQEVKLGAMGQPVPGFEIEVVDDAGRILPPNEIGHIAVKLTETWPPGLFQGYYTGGELDRSAFRHGWYYTGDTATKDEEGYLWFVGRADDLIARPAIASAPSRSRARCWSIPPSPRAR